MTPFLLLVTLHLPVAQDPPAAPPRTIDLVELKNGDQLAGRITQQVDGYVEIQLEAGATVGISMAQVAAIRRAGGTAPAVVPAALRARNEWFLLHDGQGESVGWLHASIVVGNDGVATLSEEYEFAQGRQRYQITSLCTADAQLQPLSCYFRERISEPMTAANLVPGIVASGQADRIVDERIVEATCRGDHLQVVRLDRTGRRERRVDFATGTTFPLLARAIARQGGAAVGAARLFDPASEELVQREFEAARQRHVHWEGKAQHVTELAESSSTGRNSEWLDASARTLRRELAGPTLVAVPSSADSARTMVGGVSIPSALVREVEGAFGLWAPNPAWVAVADLPPGQVALRCDAHGASIGLTRLDHLEVDTPLDTAVDAVASWFRLLHPELRVERREAVRARDRIAVRLIAGGIAAGAAQQATVDVIPHRGHFLVLVCRAPAAAWEELARDFAFLLRSLELEPQSLAPTLQGPIKAREQRASKAVGAGGAAPARPAPKGAGSAPAKAPSEAAAGTGNAVPARPRPKVRIVDER